MLVSMLGASNMAGNAHGLLIINLEINKKQMKKVMGSLLGTGETLSEGGCPCEEGTFELRLGEGTCEKVGRRDAQAGSTR